jgi:uncharacterized protein YdeI (YjbR/CyaY-like superfamily)
MWHEGGEPSLRNAATSVGAMNPKVDAYVAGLTTWQEETEALRGILRHCAVDEDLKWGKPCYSWEKRNVVIIQGFREYCALLFFKGVLLTDPDGVLVKTGENTQVGRQIRFADVQDVARLKKVVTAYVDAAIAVERSGLKVQLQEGNDLTLPGEFQRKLDESPELRAAFAALTPGRQRGYNIHFSSPKQSTTRAARVEKCLPQILRGKGLNDS